MKKEKEKELLYEIYLIDEKIKKCKAVIKKIHLKIVELNSMDIPLNKILVIKNIATIKSNEIIRLKELKEGLLKELYLLYKYKKSENGVRR